METQNKLIAVVLGIVFSATLMGCSSMSPYRVTRDFQPSPDIQAKIDEKITKTTELALDKMIDDKVEKSVEKALPKAVSDGIGKWILDTGPYGMIGLLSLLLGKHWWDLKQERRKNGKSEHAKVA